MDEKTIDDLLLPGFRFHPTDEELVEFYLKRKLRHQPLPIELIKQVDIYKYEPWDLPKLTSIGERECYFYCPRDRKYRNSVRPNRVTGLGFWKATGTDRPIYSSDGIKCIGLKKSLVFYRGRAAKGVKTDWMMHEFRLPSAGDGAPPPPKKISDKNAPATDSWAICKIFKKTNSPAQRAFSHSWVTSLSETRSPDGFSYSPHEAQFNSGNFSSTIEFNLPSYRTISAIPSSNGDHFTGNYHFSPPVELPGATNKSTIDPTSMLFNPSPAVVGGAAKRSEGIEFERTQQQFDGFSDNSLQMMQEIVDVDDGQGGFSKNQSATNIQSPWGNMGFPFSLLQSADQDSWKPSDLPWDCPPCPSEISSATYSASGIHG